MLKTIVLKNFSTKKKHKLGANVNVSRGYGRYLIRQGYVLSATEKNYLLSEKLLLEEKSKKDIKTSQALDIKNSLEKENLSFIIANCNGNGILYGAICIKDIIKKLNTINKSLYGSIKNNEVLLKNIIKEYGIYKATIYLYEGIEADINIYVGNSQESINKMIQNEKKKETENISNNKTEISEK
jgi:ribosomal protein L9